MDDDPYPSPSIDDPENLSQTQRIKELLERRKRVLDARDELYDLTLIDEQDRDDVRKAFRSRIETFIMDVWATLRASAKEGEYDPSTTDGGLTPAERYLDHEEIATVEVPPPDDLIEDDDNLGPKQPRPEPKYEKITGLRWFLENQEYITKEFHVRTFSPPKTHDEVQQVPVPLRALDKGLLKILEWIRETGIDANLSEDDGDAGFEYEDILEDGPPGDGDVPEIPPDGDGR